MCDNKRSGFFEGLVTGVVMGIAGYMYLKTDDGKKLQKDFTKKAKPYLSDLGDLLEDWKDQSGELLEKAEEIKDTLEEKFEDSKDDIETNVTKKLEGSLTHIEELQERGREATATIRKKFFKNIKKPS